MKFLMILFLAFWFINSNSVDSPTAALDAGEIPIPPAAQAAKAVAERVLVAAPTPEEVGAYISAALPPPEEVAFKIREAMPPPEVVAAHVREALDRMEASNGYQ